MKLKYLGNTKWDAGLYEVFPISGQTREDALAEHKRWLSDKVKGEPQMADAPGAKTIAELKAAGLSGVYVWTEDNQ